MTPEAYFELLSLPREFEQREAKPAESFYVARSADGGTLITNLPVSVFLAAPTSYSEVILLLAATHTLGVAAEHLQGMDSVMLLKAADLFAAEFLPPLAQSGAVAVIHPGDLLKWLMATGSWWWQMCQDVSACAH